MNIFNESGKKIRNIIVYWFYITTVIFALLVISAIFVVINYFGNLLDLKYKFLICLGALLISIFVIYLKYIIALFFYGYGNIIENTKSTTTELKKQNQNNANGCCPFCGEKIIPGTKYCGNCGKELKA